MIDPHHKSLPLTTFYNGNKKFRLQLENEQIVWDNAQSPYEKNIIAINDIVSINHNRPKKKSKELKRLTIYFAKKQKENVWRLKQLRLKHSDSQQVKTWLETLKNYLNGFTSRPKQILLFINPYGGRKAALKVYEKIAKPIFEIAGLNVVVIVSQKQNQIREVLLKHNLEGFDAVGCVGGDGTVSEVINGLILRECGARGTNADDREQNLPRPSIPIGIIPAGSSDTTAYSLHGTTDVCTAVLQIILGSTLGLDLVSVHNNSKLLQIYADVVSYGYLGDIAYYSEDFRWMGPSRYEYTGFKRIMANKGYHGNITILTEDVAENEHRCRENCEECAHKTLQIQNEKCEENKKAEKWETIDGKFFMIAGANLSCAGKRNPHGLAPYSHIGNGYLHLILIRHTSLFNSLRTLQRFTKSTYSINDLAHVEVYRTREFHFRAENHPGRWNCDGEVIQQTDIHARVHCQLVTVFGRGVSKPKSKHKGCL